MILSLRHFLGWLVSSFSCRADLVLENLALRRQLLALNRSRSIKWAAKQEKFQPKEMYFFLTSIELIRRWQLVTRQIKSEDYFSFAVDSLRTRRTVSPLMLDVCSSKFPTTNRGRSQRKLRIR